MGGDLLMFIRNVGIVWGVVVYKYGIAIEH